MNNLNVNRVSLKKIFFLYLIVLLHNFLFSESQHDSLLTSLSISTGKEKVHLLLNYSHQVYSPNSIQYNSPQQVIDYMYEALSISRKEKLIEEESKSLQFLGYAYSIMGDFENSVKFLNESLKIAKKSNLKKRIPLIYLDLGDINFDRFEYEKSLEFYKLSLKIYNKNKSKIDIAGIHKLMGNSYLKMENTEAALQHFRESLSIYKKLNEKALSASMLNNLGSVYYKQNNLSKTLESFLQSLQIREEIGEEIDIAYTWLNIGSFYIRMENYDKSLEYLMKARNLFEKFGNYRLLSQTYNTLGIVYRNLNNYDKAIENYLKALEIGETAHYTARKGAILNNLAVLLEKQNKYSEAIKYYTKALEWNKITKDISNQASCLNNIAVLYLNMFNYEQADFYFEQALNIALEYKFYNHLENIYKGLSNYYKDVGNIQKSYDNYILYTELRDSLRSEKNTKFISELQTKYETEKKEKEIEVLTKNNEIQEINLLSQKKRINLIVLSVALFFILSSIIFRIKQKEIQAQKRVEAEIKKLNKELENRVQEELKKREKQQQFLIQKSKLESMGKLAAGIAHEINQPLGGISMGLENIYFAFNENRLTAEYFDKKYKDIDGYFDRINKIIEHIKLFSRDQKTILFEKININEVIKNAFSLLQTQYKNHDVNVEFKLEKNINFVSGNKFKFEQVVINLFTNAKDAVTEKEHNAEEIFVKKIFVKTYNKKDFVYLEIIDNGFGISKEILPKIFDPFFTTKEPTKGTGLGLSIIYGIIKEMKGEISVESKIREFTKMRIKLPKIG